MRNRHLHIEAIEAFTDNYIWLLSTDTDSCAVVDPGDATPVLKRLQEGGLNLRYILLTHHHADHTGGVSHLMREYDTEVFGPDDQRIAAAHTVCKEGDVVQLAELGLEFHVLEVPAHTRSHIAFHTDHVLFPGDTLFSIGCGRFFEGTPADMQIALDKLAGLPPETRVYSAHEYTQSNCAFALAVDPDNVALQKRSDEVARLRAMGDITLPAVLSGELAANPFMRTREKSVVGAARKFNPQAAPGSTTMAVIRAWKDRF